MEEFFDNMLFSRASVQSMLVAQSALGTSKRSTVTYLVVTKECGDENIAAKVR